MNIPNRGDDDSGQCQDIAHSEPERHRDDYLS